MEKKTEFAKFMTGVQNFERKMQEDFRLKQELDVIYIAKDGTRFISYEEAVKYADKLSNREKEEEARLFMDIEKVLAVLEERGYGVYYKSQPLRQMAVQGEPPIYQINEVSNEEVIRAVSEEGVDLDE